MLIQVGYIPVSFSKELMPFPDSKNMKKNGMFYLTSSIKPCSDAVKEENGGNVVLSSKYPIFQSD
jgi:hypothetical protein